MQLAQREITELSVGKLEECNLYVMSPTQQPFPIVMTWVRGKAATPVQ